MTQSILFNYHKPIGPESYENYVKKVFNIKDFFANNSNNDVLMDIYIYFKTYQPYDTQEIFVSLGISDIYLPGINDLYIIFKDTLGKYITEGPYAETYEQKDVFDCFGYKEKTFKLSNFLLSKNMIVDDYCYLCISIDRLGVLSSGYVEEISVIGLGVKGDMFQ